MYVDPRGPRFGAWIITAITTAALAVVLVTRTAWLVGAQTAVFAFGAFAGLRYQPYGGLFRHLITPRLDPPATISRTSAVAFRNAASGICLGGEFYPFTRRITIKNPKGVTA